MSQERNEQKFLSRVEGNPQRYVFAELEGEEFRDVVGWNGYYKVSNYGRVIFVGRNIQINDRVCFYRTKLLTPRVDTGYVKINLSKGGLKRGVRVHRIIAEAFIPNPHNKPQVNHINGIKTDNRIENLEWVTSQENLDHAYKTGLKDKVTNSILTVDNIIQIKKLLLKGTKHKIIAKQFGVAPGTINHISCGQRWHWVK